MTTMPAKTLKAPRGPEAKASNGEEACNAVLVDFCLPTVFFVSNNDGGLVVVRIYD
jgi:hypothetical protein